MAARPKAKGKQSQGIQKSIDDLVQLKVVHALLSRRFFEELDYVAEGRNGEVFASHMAKDLPQVRCVLLHGQPTLGIFISVEMCAASWVVFPRHFYIR
jgi:hypothetical protein